MMASSQVEFTPSSPFGCVHTRRPVSNSHDHHIDYTDLWVHRPHWKPTTTRHNNTISNVNEKDNRNTKESIGISNKIETYGDHKDKWSRAREMVFSIEKCHQVDDRQSESSVEVHSSGGGGVSSLVRKWRGFEKVAKCTSNNFPPPPAPAPSPAHAPEEDSFGDWESERTTISGTPSFRSSTSRDYSDATEKDRCRVSDIIRKLTEECSLNDNDHAATPPRIRTSLDQQLEQRCFSPVVNNSPRIRGRQAFNDLLMQMERERHKELEGLVARNAVSKFSHRGRIQALLRFKFLRGHDIEDNLVTRHSNGASTSVHCRERVKSSLQNSSVHIEKCHEALIDSIPTIDEQKENHHQEEEATHSKSYAVPDLDHIQDEQQVVTPKEQDVQSSSQNLDPQSSTFTWQETNCYKNNRMDTESVERTESSDSVTVDMHPKNEEATSCQQVVGSKYELTGDCDDSYWVSDVCHAAAEGEWEELSSEYQQEEEVDNRDWIYEVSRPRSDWEGLRQARYQEMLDPFLENEDIRALLGRKSVSNFLSSDLRNQIDRVMLSRAQGQKNQINNQTGEQQENVHEEEVRVEKEEDEKEVVGIEEGEDAINKLDEERENYGGYYDKYEEAESSVGPQSNDCDDYITSTSPSWPQNQGHDASTYSSLVASPSPQSNFYSQDSRPSSAFSAHPAIEMEIIYDLRRHMEQLQQEMSELRRSIKCCVNMQSKFQRSFKQEVPTATNNSSDEKKGRGKCCICCKTQVDSLLYRCGHMCTCFKCAEELQWSSGKCPICRAPIIDVVRTYYNS